VALAKGEARNDNRLVPTLPAPIWAIVAWLVLALSWLRLLPRAVDLPPVLADGVLLVFSSFSPVIVAHLLIGYCHAGAGRWRWLGEGFHWRVGARWYVVTVAGPVLPGSEGPTGLGLRSTRPRYSARPAFRSWRPSSRWARSTGGAVTCSRRCKVACPPATALPVARTSVLNSTLAPVSPGDRSRRRRPPAETAGLRTGRAG
jgi:hypothetical protein